MFGWQSTAAIYWFKSLGQSACSLSFLFSIPSLTLPSRKGRDTYDLEKLWAFRCVERSRVPNVFVSLTIANRNGDWVTRSDPDDGGFEEFPLSDYPPEGPVVGFGRDN